jgi:hypothetical protein
VQLIYPHPNPSPQGEGLLDISGSLSRWERARVRAVFGVFQESLTLRYLFKLADELQARLDELNQRRKENSLAAGEDAELIGILELDRIFTLLNAKILVDSRRL